MLEINKIYCGDCLELMPLIDDDSIDMILCDLPYGTTACKWDSVIPFVPLWEQYKRIIKDNGAIVLTASQPFTSKLVMSNIKMFKYEWIWNKTNATGFTMANYRPLKQHENVCVFSKAAATSLISKKSMNYNPQGLVDCNINVNNKGFRHEAVVSGGDTTKTYTREKTGYPKIIIIFNSHKSNQHPTQKPVALFEYLIKTYTNENELVLDNCIGSGTTAIACWNANRNFIGMEQEQKYVDIANKRLEQTFKQEQLL